MLPVRLEGAIWAAVQYSANDIQNHMRQHAPWTDRTSNARQGLFTRAFRDAKGYTIILAHSVPYGIWLEVRHDGRYAIINPTLQIKGREVMRRLQGLLDAAS